VWSLEVTGTVTSLLGLETISEVTNSLYVHDTEELATLEGLDGLEKAGLVITGNTGLSSLAGLEGVRQVTTLVLANNVGLSDLAALTLASFAGSSATITGNEGLPNLEGFESMTEIDAMVLDNNVGLSSLDGLDNLQSVRSLTLTSNPDLVDANLPSLVDTEYLTIASDPILAEVKAPSLSSATGLVLVSCPELSLVDLSSLETAGSLYLADDAMLADLGDTSTWSAIDTATITANPLLSQCLVDEIAPLVGDCTCEDNGDGPCVTAD
jgi:hypothetical protein